MKKYVALLLVVVLAVCLCACGNETDKIKNALVQGSWTRQFTALGVNCTIVYTFEEDGTALVVSDMGGNENTESATYTITEEKILFTYDSGEEFDIFYDYENGNLSLHMVGSEGDVFPFIHTP